MLRTYIILVVAEAGTLSHALTYALGQLPPHVDSAHNNPKCNRDSRLNVSARAITVRCPEFTERNGMCEDVFLGKPGASFHGLAVLVFDKAGQIMGCGLLYGELSAPIKKYTPKNGKQPKILPGGQISVSMTAKRLLFSGVVTNCTRAIHVKIARGDTCTNPGEPIDTFLLPREPAKLLPTSPYGEPSYCRVSGILRIDPGHTPVSAAGKALLLYDSRDGTIVGCGVLKLAFAVSDIENEPLQKPFWGKYPTYDRYAPRGTLAVTFEYDKKRCSPNHEFDADKNMQSPGFPNCKSHPSPDDCVEARCKDKCDNVDGCGGFTIQPDIYLPKCHLKRKGFRECGGISEEDAHLRTYTSYKQNGRCVEE